MTRIKKKNMEVSLSNLGITSCWNEKVQNIPNTCTGLNLYGNKLKNLEGFPFFFFLKSLDLRGNELVSLNGMPYLPYLEELHLDRNNLINLKGFPNLPKLKSLHLDNNNLTNLEGFPELHSLKVLYLDGNNLTNLGSFPELPKLNYLYLDGNNLTNLEGFPELPELKILHLQDNNLNSLMGMPDLPRLEELHMYRNPINSLIGFPYLPNLETLMGGKDIKPYLNLNLLETIKFYNFLNGKLEDLSEEANEAFQNYKEFYNTKKEETVDYSFLNKEFVRILEQFDERVNEMRNVVEKFLDGEYHTEDGDPDPDILQEYKNYLKGIQVVKYSYMDNYIDKERYEDHEFLEWK